MSKTAVVIGVGPGLGMSIAHRFGRAGHDVALISRTDTRHPDYVAALADAGVRAETFTADVRDRAALHAALDAATERLGPADVLYYGPGAADSGVPLVPVTELDSTAARAAAEWAYPAIDAVGHALPAMLERGSGTLLFAGGLSAVVPMPAIGAFTLSAAALRNYVITLHAALFDSGVHAGILTIGGLIERSDIHRAVLADPERFGGTPPTIDPDELAEAAWRLHVERDRPEEVFNAFA
ncbi:SDR family NAD(P)-dependent oxidoreductase [Saccharothrix obliqua]|uniref:SDR family NAD(P)-dependent oxidoreductase n=1 Tax=Saccharothrix obliqua TaxID=2861747 RepID=UPI001C604620|nr:SDR family NAD(P)-dependent oxidoreductase [Saccharothrix obliqua]MBW4717973.1 SDR family NAD(P)-dependent oxidoreductase [Saccharothrix obliqua]